MVDERRQKKTDELIKKMKDSKCQWPQCKEKSMISVSIPMLKGEGKEAKLSESEALAIPMCMFHMACMEAVPVGVKIDEEKKQTFLVGGMDMVNSVEIIISACVNSGRLKAMFKEKEDVDKKVEETQSAQTS